MLRKLTLVVIVAVALVGSGVAFLLVPGSEPDAQTERVVPAVSATAVPVRPVALKPRPGRVMGFDQALRELDLIRPSRAKLAEDFGAPLLDGRPVKLSEHRGKVVLVNFWATWCPPCREEMPAMERLWQQHKDQGFVILAVSVDSVEAKVKPFVQEHGFTFPVVLDSAMDVANAYGVRALPSSFFVDRQGQLAALALGPRRWDGDASHSLVEALLRR